MASLNASNKPLGSEFSTAQLVEALEWKIHTIKEDPAAKAAQQDKVTKDQVLLLENDIINLQAAVTQLSNKVNDIWEFNRTLAPIPMSTETILQATRKAYEKYPLSFRKSKKREGVASLVQFLLYLNGLSLEGDSTILRARLENALKAPCVDETSDAELTPDHDDGIHA